jgi:uncharacterized membrane protein (UPF0182 family)
VSGIFEGDAAAARPRRLPSRRPRALIPTLAIVVVLAILFSVYVEVWTNRLWFDSLGYGGVFTTMFWTKVGLFVVFGGALAAATVGNAIIAFRTRPILIGDGYRNPTVERYQDTIDPIRQWVLTGVGVIMFVFAGASAAGHWKTYLLWRNGEPFGQQDVYFHRDVGFFVFGYPWYRFVVSFGFTLLIVTLLVTAATHYLYGGIRLQGARNNRMSSAAQVQISVIVGIFMLLKAVSYWLDRYGLAISSGHLFTGISYTDAHAVLPAKNILAVIAVICALLFFGNVFRPGWMLPVLGLGLLILSSLLIGGIWPAIVQRFQVKPSEPDKESHYIGLNIAATRDAFGVADVRPDPYAGVSTDTASQLQAKAAELPGVRLIDPKLVSPAFEQLQQSRTFYQMPDVLDVDRYVFTGGTEPQDVVLAARELNLDNLADSQKNWANEHTVYTHGYGVVAAYGTKRSPAGEPVWVQQDLPSVGKLSPFKQEVYYGESEPAYSIVGAPSGATPVELNIPAGDAGQDETSTYQGKGGVPVGSTFNQLLYAAKFWDSSILLSGRVNSESKIIYDRDPRQMVMKVAPWLDVDGDPYPAVVGGRLLWILDGYTTSSDYPMSNLVDFSDATSDSLTTETASVAGQKSDNVNYIRNSVKAVVDAYDGTVSLYQWDDQDPILQAWMRAFPGTVQPRSAISTDLLDHLRYPEDLFKVQREVLARYHVQDPLTFYQGSENWEAPTDPEHAGELQPPFYLSVKLPGKESEFSLTSVYVPRGRQNMAAFMAVNADAASPDYGQFTILQLPTNSAVSGPSQAANAMQNDPDVTQALLPYKNSATQIQYGNLLTLPVGDEMLYVEPVYTSRLSSGSYPILQKVLVSLGSGATDEGGQVGISTSFDGALADALGLTAPSGGGTNPPPNGGGKPPTGGESQQQELTRLLNEAASLFDQADAALHTGDLAEYQRLNDEGVAKLREAQALQQEIVGTPTTGPTSGSPSSGATTTSGGG